MTEIIFKFDPLREFDNFKNTSKSANHLPPTKLYLLYTKKYGRLDRRKVKKFIEDYILQNQIDIDKIKIKIEQSWNKAKKPFFLRAEEIFKNKLPEKKLRLI